MTSARTDKWLDDTSAGDPVAEVARRALQARLDAVQHCLPLAVERATEGVEHVHQLRVWTRRAEAALKLYREFLPRRRATPMKKRLRRIRRAAGQARDCDVLKGHLASAAPELVAELEAERAQAQKPLATLQRRLTRNQRFERQVAKLLKRVRPRGKRADTPPGFGHWARNRLQPIVSRFFEADLQDDYANDALHRFRIRCKKLRYAMELLGAVFPAEFRVNLYPLVETLQDKLGEISDLATVRARLREKFKRADDRLSRLKDLLAERQEHLDRARQEFRNWWTPQLRDRLRSGFEEMLRAPMALVG